MSRTIRYQTAPCALGHLLVAAGDRGIAHLRFGDCARALEAAFSAAFPEARLARDDDPVRGFVDALVARVAAWDGQGAPPELPLDALEGTPFQRRVWAHLCTIPSGETRSYGEVAAAIGHPRGARAVASACARNPVAWLVPCHRVVAGSGAPGGYRWGAERKRALLARESITPGEGAGRVRPPDGAPPSLL